MNRFDDDDDDYVASLLKKEAKTTSPRGLPSFRLTGAAPKPNTRFLRNIVREADTHNAALRAKESAEARARLRRLQREKEGRLSRSPSPRRVKRRLPDQPRSPDSHQHHRKRRRPRSPSRSRGRRGSSRTGRHDSDRRKMRRSRSRSSERDKHSRYQRRRERSKKPRRRRSRSGSRHEPDGGRSKGHEERKHRRKERRRSRSRTRDQDATTRKLGSKEKHIEKHYWRDSLEVNDEDLEDRLDPPGSPGSAFSDPLDEVIGPAPPPKPYTRGRGATGQATMDQRFLESYDPTMDVRLDSDGHDDFDDALEAYRDRQKWKQQAAQRFRSVGLGEDFIKASKTNDIKDESNLKWAKKGSTREWDRGKILDDDDGGEGVDLRADWIKKQENV